MPPKKTQVALLMGSDSDLPMLKPTIDTFAEFGVLCEVRVMSAHRTPTAVEEFVKSAPKKGIKVILAAAGGAAHLAGVVAGHTTLPVIGIPIPGTALSGLDSLLSMVQMPSGIPVATVAVGMGGPTNAALFAIQILASSSPALARKLKTHRSAMARKVAAKDKKVQSLLAEG